MSYTDNKILLTKNNLFQKAYSKWSASVAPRKIMFSAMICDLLNDGEHVLAASVLMSSNGQMRRSAAEVYWAQLMGKEITEFEVRQCV